MVGSELYAADGGQSGDGGTYTGWRHDGRFPPLLPSPACSSRLLSDCHILFLSATPGAADP